MAVTVTWDGPPRRLPRVLDVPAAMRRYGLRHGAASHMLAAGKPLTAVAVQLDAAAGPGATRPGPPRRGPAPPM